MNRWCATAVFAALFTPGAALAADVQFCVEIETSFTDSSWTEGSQAPDWKLNVSPTPLSPVTEDYWTTKVFERPPRGAKYNLRRNGGIVQTGYLGDGFDANKPAGCTDNLTGVNLLASWTIDVYSEGMVQGNYVYSYDHTKASRVNSSLYLGFNPPAGRNPTVLFPASSDPITADVMAGYFAESFALYRHAGGEAGNKYYLYRCDCALNAQQTDCINLATHTDSCGCQYVGGANPWCRIGGNDSSDGWTDLSGNWWRVCSMTPYGLHRKFTVVHELGHAIATTISNGKPNGGDHSDLDTSDNCSTPTADGHAFWSREWQHGAFGEAYAQFYSADVWNSHSSKDCAFKYWATNANTNTYGQGLGGSVFDCAGDDGADFGSVRDDFTNGQSVTSVDWLKKCNGDPWLGKATELDYTRLLWNVHTDGTTPPTFTDIARWIRDAPAFTRENVYTQLDAAAEPRNDSLEANWDVNKTAHNVDNPAP